MGRRTHGDQENTYSDYYAYYPLTEDYNDHAGSAHLTGDFTSFPFVNGGCEFNTSGKGLTCPIPIAKYKSQMPDFQLSMDCLKYSSYASYPNLFDAWHAINSGFNWQCVSSNWGITIGGQTVSLPKSSLPVDVWMKFRLTIRWSAKTFSVSINKYSSSDGLYPAVLSQTRTLPSDAVEGTGGSFVIGHCGNYSSRQWGGLIRNVSIKLL